MSVTPVTPATIKWKWKSRFYNFYRFRLNCVHSSILDVYCIWSINLTLSESSAMRCHGLTYITRTRTKENGKKCKKMNMKCEWKQKRLANSQNEVDIFGKFNCEIFCYGFGSIGRNFDMFTVNSNQVQAKHKHETERKKQEFECFTCTSQHRRLIQIDLNFEYTSKTFIVTQFADDKQCRRKENQKKNNNNNAKKIWINGKHTKRFSFNLRETRERAETRIEKKSNASHSKYRIQKYLSVLCVCVEIVLEDKAKTKQSMNRIHSNQNALTIVDSPNYLIFDIQIANSQIKLKSIDNNAVATPAIRYTSLSSSHGCCRHSHRRRQHFHIPHLPIIVSCVLCLFACLCLC